MSKTTLRFMGEGEVEHFRCRIYGREEGERVERVEKLAFLRLLATEGVREAPAYDKWLTRLHDVGWVDGPEWEPAPGGGHYRRWRLNDAGRAALAELEAS